MATWCRASTGVSAVLYIYIYIYIYSVLLYIHINWNLESKHQWNLYRFHRRMKILSQESLFQNAIRYVFVALARPQSQCVIGHVMKKVISLMRSFKCRYIKSYIYKSLTHWGRLTHICVSNLAIIGSDNGLSSDRHQAIILTNAGILLIGPLETN